MKNRIRDRFEELKAAGKTALVPFITAGDPNLKTTARILEELDRSGADVIELGIPFSDPMADGPTIQASSERALKNGVNIKDVLGLVKDFRKKSEVPVVLFGYYNPIFSYGCKRFADAAKRAGADGVLVVDLPPEESAELKRELDRVGMDLVVLMTPTSSAVRMRQISKGASGFVYYVSVAGVTGARKTLKHNIKDAVKTARKVSRLPVSVGFGISTPAQAGVVASFSDGVVVGSAIINIIAKNVDGKGRPAKDLTEKVGRFVRGLKRAIS